MAKLARPGTRKDYQPKMTLVNFMVWLAKGRSQVGFWVLRQVIAYVALLIEHSPWVLEASPSVLQAPIVEGASRMRRLPRSTKEALAAGAAEGS